MNPTQSQADPREQAAPGASEHHTHLGITPAAAAQQQQFLLCEHCHAPVDRDQRYCVRCGARQSHARDPATTYFAAAARSRRTRAAQARPEGKLRGPLFALVLVLLPLGVAVGVLVGRGGSGSGNDKLISELAKQPLVVTSPSGAAAATPAASEPTPGSLPSDFSLPRGFAVKLSTLPLRGTGQAAVAKAEQEARAKGASQVGLINPKDFKTNPSQGASNYVIYSGQFKTRAEADKALAKLRPRFPGAQVIAVEPLASAPAPVLAHTEYGEAHQIAGSRPTPQKIAQDKQVVQKINHTVGKSYVQAQKGLPDTIVVTGGSGGSNSSAAEKLGEH